MNRRLFPLAVAAGLSTEAAAEPPRHELNLSVSPPQVKILPVAAGRRFVHLPDLEYLFLLEPRCDNDWQPGAVALSVADSRLRIDARERGGPAEPLEVRLQIPAEQLAPVPVSGFCELEESAAPVPATATAPGELTITAVLSAQASLLCTAGEVTRITYSATTLDVSLLCDRTTTGANSGPPASESPSERQR